MRSWNEFKEKYCNECGYFYEVHKNRAVKTSSPISMCNQLTPHEAKALAAFSKLLKGKVGPFYAYKNTSFNAFYEYCCKTRFHSIQICRQKVAF